MPTFQESLSQLRIVQIEGSVVFLLTFEGGAIQAYQCELGNFVLNEDINPNDVRILLRNNQNDDDDGDDEDDDD